MYFPFFFDPTMILLLPALIIAFWAQAKVSSTFEKYVRQPSTIRLPAAQVAKQLLENSGVYGVNVEMIPGQLTDHYDPRSKTLRLSQAVFSSNSIAAIGVAAHEAGHAIQHATRYVPLGIRNSL
ncbi:MAG: zinc metallopeptidase, partial [Clostridia bacterium]|nr:zinc metallopeptidase [Clostridia bacterium]